MIPSVTCVTCGKEFKPSRVSAKFCSDTCRVKFARTKTVTLTSPNDVTLKVSQIKKKKSTEDMTFNEYFGSEQYSEDIREFVKRSDNKSSYGGITKDGYTYFILEDGTRVSIPVSRKTQ